MAVRMSSALLLISLKHHTIPRYQVFMNVPDSKPEAVLWRLGLLNVGACTSQIPVVEDFILACWNRHLPGHSAPLLFVKTVAGREKGA
jgi:hypothetical protein